jgi:hypothetical protein
MQRSLIKMSDLDRLGGFDFEAAGKRCGLLQVFDGSEGVRPQHFSHNIVYNVEDRHAELPLDAKKKSRQNKAATGASTTKARPAKKAKILTTAASTSAAAPVVSVPEAAASDSDSGSGGDSDSDDDSYSGESEGDELDLYQVDYDSTDGVSAGGPAGIVEDGDSDGELSDDDESALGDTDVPPWFHALPSWHWKAQREAPNLDDNGLIGTYLLYNYHPIDVWAVVKIAYKVRGMAATYCIRLDSKLNNHLDSSTTLPKESEVTLEIAEYSTKWVHIAK